VLWLELSPDKAAGMRQVFTVLGLLMLATTPLVFLIPDGARDRRRAAEREEAARAQAALATARETLAPATVAPVARAQTAGGYDGRSPA
jgi:hypothetical protein